MTALLGLLMALVLSAQAPDAFNYQAVARNAMGDPLVNTAIGIRFQLHQGTPMGTVVYAETHATATNALGLFTLQMGQGSATQGSFAGVDWGSGPYYLEVGLDAAGGSNYLVMGTQQMLSVPYALFAQRTPCFSTSLLGDTLFTGNGCFVIIPGVSAANGGCLDLDQDGFYDRPGCGPVDCIDTLATANPAAAEICGDGLDNDCDGQLDELTDPQAFIPWFADSDGDGFGNNAVVTMACAQPAGYVANNDDCDDADAQVFPGSNCSLFCSEADADYIAQNQVTYLNELYFSAFTCFLSGGFSSLDEACVLAELGQLNLVSASCNTCSYQLLQCLLAECLPFCTNGVNATCAGCLMTEGCLTQFASCVSFTDLDGDGWASESDCNDADPAVYPLAGDASCDGIDNNCNGLVDELVPIWYQDGDADGFGDSNVSEQTCTPPAGYIQTGGDCDDSDPLVNPGMAEGCNGIDDDCDGDVDTGCSEDLDADGYDSTVDCDDNDPLIYPGAPEVCADGLDNDCDGAVDDCSAAEVCDGIDNDGDGQVDEDGDGDGFSVCQGDCDDTDPLINPGAFDFPGNGIDENCNGGVDEQNTSCSSAPKFTGVSAMDLANAMGLCVMTTANSATWGIISAEQSLPDGSMPSSSQTGIMQNQQSAVLSDYGTGGVVPTAGATLAGLSTGNMRDSNDPGFVQPASGTVHSAVATTLPGNYMLANGNSLQATNSCLGTCTPGSGSYDPVNLRLVIRVPTNASGFTYQFRFFSSDYLQFSCGSFNDHHLALLSSQATGLPADGNIARDALNNPVSVNSGLIDVCTPNGCRSCVQGSGALAGTGMDIGNVGGGTSWVTVSAPVVPGEVITLELMIFDVGDAQYDANVLFDNFQWIPAQP
jgi:hypothetical protein